MATGHRFQRLVGISAILFAVLQLSDGILLFAAVKFRAEALTNPALLLSGGQTDPGLFRWSMILDMFAYLLFAPMAVLCWHWFRSRSPGMVTIYTLCGLAFSLIGSAGAVMLGAVIPTLIAAYALSGEAQRQTIEILAGTFYRAVSLGLWNPLEILLLGVWLIGIGFLLRRERMGLGILSLVVGCFAMLDVLGWISNVELIFNIGVGGQSLLLIWPVWFGIDLLRRPIANME
jgi:hypothetical protein